MKIDELNKINIKSIMDIKEISKHYESRNDYLTHQKKVIDRLSRKIQRRNREFKKLAVSYGTQVHKSMLFEEVVNELLLERERAINYIENNLSWSVGSEELIKILEGKDEIN